MATLLGFYSALIEDPFEVFMVMPDGKVITRAEIYAKMNTMEGIFDFNSLDLFPTSCNPLHDGHRDIYDGIPIPEKKAYELSICRIGKETLTCEELESRVAQFAGYAPILITNSAKFLEKGAVLSFIDYVRFHVGTDTIERLRDDCGEIGIQGLKCSFEIYDRDMEDGKGMVVYPTGWKHVPKNAFRSYRNPPNVIRKQMSSSKIRAERAKTNG